MNGNALYLREGFVEAAIDEGRLVRIGDVISLFSMKNSFLLQGTNTVTQGATLTRPEDLPRGSYKELFIIEDPSQPAGPGNANPIMYGGTILLRAFNGQYITASDNGNVTLQDNRLDGRAVFMLEGDNLQSINSVTYGDSVYFKNTNADSAGIYMTAKDDVSVIMTSRGPDAHFSLQDKYGQGLNVNWARLGKASQSSTYQNYDAYFALDGKLLTFNSTNSEKNPWWEVVLPKEIYIDRIIIKNRVNGGDAVAMRLSDFSIIIKDAHDVELARKVMTTQSATSEFSWNNAYHVGRVVRISINDTNPQYLNMGEVQIFGMPVNHSVLLNKPTMADLTTYAVNNNIVATDSQIRVFEHQEVPLAKDNMSIAFWINIDPKTYSQNANKFKGILLKGTGNATDSTGIKSPGVWLTPTNPNLKIAVSTGNNLMDGIDSSSIKLPLGKPVHIAVTISAGISSKTGWNLGHYRPAGFPDERFVIFHPIQKRYYVLTGVDTSNYAAIFGKVNMFTLDDLDAAGFQNLGNFDQSQGSPDVRLYVNGRLSDAKTLSSLPMYNTAPLTFNPDKLLFATFYEVKYTNYTMTPLQVHSLAVLRSENLCKTLVAKTIDAKANMAEFSHSELPAFESALTLTFWANILEQSGNKKIPLVMKGSIDDPEFGILLWENAASLNVPVKTKKYPILEGIDRPGYSTAFNSWTHFALVIGSGIATVYVNGSSVGKANLSKDLNTNYQSLFVGGFAGRIQNCKFCNYALSPEEIPMIMGMHPDTTSNQQLKAAFEKAGCTGYPYGIDKDAGAASDLKTMLANSRGDQVDAAFNKIKTSADAYVGGDASTENKAASDMCYGDIKLMNLPASASGASAHLGVSCLPEAPFTCAPQVGVNDFDIRTHRDFYKYVQTSNVKPPPTLGTNASDYVKVSDLASDPTILSKILTDNPSIAQSIATELTSSDNSASSQNSPVVTSVLTTSALLSSTSTALAAALANPAAARTLVADSKIMSDLSNIDPALAQSVAANPSLLANLVKTNPAVAKVVSSDLVANSSLLSQLNVSSQPAKKSAPSTPDAASIQKILLANPSTAASVISSYVQNTADASTVKNIAASLVASQKLDVTSLVKQLPPSQLNTMLQASAPPGTAKNLNVNALVKDDTAVQNIVNSLVKSGKVTPQLLLSQIGDTQEFRDVVSATCSKDPQPIQDHPDFPKFIDKQKIPCWNCSFDD